ncbi:hypothetical protein MWU75_11805 [Ornithinimicrobium sp. F0845]|uniref:hypothetical protein n=1 Tax=Ornithinimicrobium sp. F0845 TaxID=2926412 RepID=UPI001FF5AF9C|nr:hypothetical protein [Ornithinimicrobium sp. F0845]MCK0112825.1 hypothetical protein [Ornithinimicrobium sp. F0845]
MVEALVGRDVEEGQLDALSGDEAAPLAGRIWDLHHQYRSYAAAYLALAEALESPLHTCDAKLDSGGHNVVVHVHGQHDLPHGPSAVDVLRSQ